MTLDDFEAKLDWEGWHYMLHEVLSEEIEHPELAKAHAKAKKAFREFQELFESLR